MKNRWAEYVRSGIVREGSPVFEGQRSRSPGRFGWVFKSLHNLYGQHCNHSESEPLPVDHEYSWRKACRLWTGGGPQRTYSGQGGAYCVAMCRACYFFCFFWPTSTKPRAWKLSKNNGCDDFLFGVHCVEEGDRIPPLQSYGQALKQKDCFSGVLGDDCGASANLLD